MTVVLSVQNVSKTFRRRAVLNDVSFDVRRGEAVAVVGENGAGKTTLLRICAGLLAPDNGTVAHSGRVAYCPQDPGLMDHLTADEHLRYVGAGLGLSATAARGRGAALFDWLRFPGDETGTVRELSMGTRQKINLALALLADAPLILLDEPYQGFDRGTYDNFWNHIADWRAAGAGVVVVTHMLAELHRVDRVLELRAGGSWAFNGAERGVLR
jgi:ABC-type multidrug transport system ATPase subunit